MVEIPDPIKGSRIIAVVTQKLDEKQTLKKMAEHLPKITIPKQIFVMEELSKMGSGKIDFRSVTKIVAEKMHKEGCLNIKKAAHLKYAAFFI